MITEQENETLTRIGPGTPCGELMRRYWHPIAGASELDYNPTKRVRILGEDLVLYRDRSGTMGLIEQQCAHRRVDLFYGIPEATGLRCPYHGWLYDEKGTCIAQPYEQAIDPDCLTRSHVTLKAYPVQELGGLIWAYLGPQPAPLLPRWDILMRDDLNKEIRISHLPCSWLQCMDNSLDPTHFEHLHGVYGNYVMKKMGKPPAMNPARHLKIEFDVFEYGIYKRRLLEGQDPETSTDWTVGHPILFPNTLAQGGPDAMSFQIRVPMDDTHTLHVVINGRRPADGQEANSAPVVHHEELKYDDMGRVVAPYIVVQDEMAWAGQGPITDRTAEHLATSDKGIMLYRKLLHENMETAMRGDDPMAVIRDPGKNFPMIRIERGSTYAAFRQGVDTSNYGGALVREEALAAG
jgi:5,5'-dehydrodivanillate O-demethylase